MRYLKIISILLGIFLFLSCSKNDEEINPFTINYIEGNEYIQTFYHTRYQIIHPDVEGYDKMDIYRSICGRWQFDLCEPDEKFGKISPPQDLIDKIKELNHNIENKNLKYYLIADIRARYRNKYQADIISLESDWNIVFGGMENYHFNGVLYKHLITADGFIPLLELISNNK